MGRSGNAAAGNKAAGDTVGGKPVDGIQEAGSPEDDARADVTPEDVNQVDDALHWVDESLAGAILGGETQVVAILGDAFQRPGV